MVIAEEAFVVLDGYESRRIYQDDSGSGYATGFKGIPALTLLLFCFGVLFGLLYGVLIWFLTKIIRRYRRKAE